MSKSQAGGPPPTGVDQHQELYDVFMQAPIPMVILSGPTHRFTLVNPLYEKLIGRKALNKEVLEVFSKEEVERFIPLLDQVYQTGIPYIGKEQPFSLLDDAGNRQRLFLHIGYYPFREANGTIKGVLAFVQDVTEQVQSRLAIEESESRFRRISDEVSLTLWTARADGTVDWTNRWWSDYSGSSQGAWDYEGSPVHGADRDLLRCRFKDGLATGEKIEAEVRLRRAADGQYRWHLVQAVPVKDEKGVVVKWVGNSQDIHEQKTLVKRLEEEREIRERFVNTLTHDLRTPLTIAKMTAQLLLKKCSPLLDAFSGIQRIIDSVGRAEKMVRDLLDANRLKAGEGMPLAIAPCKLNDVIETAVRELSSLHGPRFRVLEPREVITGFWDRDALHRVVENLASNAVKYGAPDSVITIDVSTSDKGAEIALHNEGKAIPLEDQAGLFRDFRRTSMALSSGLKGWGIGLRLVKGIVDAHGGSVRLESAPDRGTTFYVEVPLDCRAQ